MKHTIRYMILAACLCLSLCGCSAREERTEFFAMDTEMDFTVYGSKAKEALSAAEAEVAGLDNLLSAQSQTSQISSLNESGSVTDAETAALVVRAAEIAAMTGGAYDPTLYPISCAWGFSNQDYRVPGESEIAELLQKSGWEKISVTGDTVTLPAGTELDLGGIAKGYAAGRAKEILREAGVKSAILSLGGNVTVLGSKPNGEDWRIGLQDPDDASGCFGTVLVSDACVVTSGGYQRYFEQDGEIYWHILDPETGKPAKSGMKSVTVVSADDTLADALSTALFVMGPEKAEAFWREHSDSFDAVWMTDDGSIFVTSGLDGRFQSERSYEVLAP